MDDANEFETESPTVVHAPEQWSADEVAWMLAIAERTDARRAAENTSPVAA